MDYGGVLSVSIGVCCLGVSGTPATAAARNPTRSSIDGDHEDQNRLLRLSAGGFRLSNSWGLFFRSAADVSIPGCTALMLVCWEIIGSSNEVTLDSSCCWEFTRIGRYSGLELIMIVCPG